MARLGKAAQQLTPARKQAAMHRKQHPGTGQRCGAACVSATHVRGACLEVVTAAASTRQSPRGVRSEMPV